jgi:hypothetical protein
MKRKAVHIAAAAAELVRFFALMFLAESLGALRSQSGADRIFRYAAAPQLLFPAGFFFLWLDPDRYAAYRPLLAAGKGVGMGALVPLAFLAVALLRSDTTEALSPSLSLGLLAAIGAIDAFSLAVLLALKQPHAEPGKDRADIIEVVKP